MHTSFDEALVEFREFLLAQGDHSSLCWLSKRCVVRHRKRLWVYRGHNKDYLSGNRVHFELAIKHQLNKALVYYGECDSVGVAVVESPGLDHQDQVPTESNGLEFKKMLSELKLIPVSSHLYWRWLKFRFGKENELTRMRGWPE